MAVSAAKRSDVYVEAKNLEKIYGAGQRAVIALRNASCTIRPGDRIAVVGPSGSGKSTLLQLFGGLEQPTSGRLSWPMLGEREGLRPEKVAFVFQSESLLPQLSVIENVELPLLLQDRVPEVARRRALEVLLHLGLAELASKLPESLSGGQAQRIAVARALAVTPYLLLVDEPTGQLDRAGADRLLDRLLAALRPTDALIIATHDDRVAARMATAWHICHGILTV